jgi:hypothetical protein
MPRPNNHQRRYQNSGRFSKMTPETLQKLEDAFSNGAPDKEACLYAGISPSTLYSYQARNPKFSERKEQLKLTPNIAARRTIVASLGDVNTAKWWLEKKDPDMKPMSKIEHSGTVTTEEDQEIERSPEELVALKALREARLKRIRDNSDKIQ